MPWRILKVRVPSLTVPAAQLTVWLRLTFWRAGRVALLGRRRLEHALLAARPDQRLELQLAAGGVAVERGARTATTSTIAPRRSTRTAGSSPWPPRTAYAYAIDPATGKTLWHWQAGRRHPLAEGAAPVRRPRARLLDGRQRRAGDRRHAGLPPRLARREDRACPTRSSARTASSTSMDGLGYPLVPLAVDDSGSARDQRGAPGAQGEARRDVECRPRRPAPTARSASIRPTARSPTARRRSSSAT